MYVNASKWWWYFAHANYPLKLSAARIAGMHTDLHFHIGSRYSIVLLVFFITYFLFEIPSNVALRKVGAARWLSFIAMSWGVVILGGGFSKKWTVRLSGISCIRRCWHTDIPGHRT
jgi:hypothetical protein